MLISFTEPCIPEHTDCPNPSQANDRGCPLQLILEEQTEESMAVSLCEGAERLAQQTMGSLIPSNIRH